VRILTLKWAGRRLGPTERAEASFCRILHWQTRVICRHLYASQHDVPALELGSWGRTVDLNRYVVRSFRCLARSLEDI